MASTEMSKLAAISSKLNQKSDTLNTIISSINTKLASMKIGLEVWLEDHSVESGDSFTTYAPNDPMETIPIQNRDVTLLGYTRINDKWMLAVKSAVVTSISNTGEADPEITESSELRPLLNASREIRAKSMGLIPRLLTEIKNQAEDILDSIEEARKAAEEL